MWVGATVTGAGMDMKTCLGWQGVVTEQSWSDTLSSVTEEETRPSQECLPQCMSVCMGAVGVPVPVPVHGARTSRAPGLHTSFTPKCVEA